MVPLRRAFEGRRTRIRGSDRENVSGKQRTTRSSKEKLLLSEEARVRDILCRVIFARSTSSIWKSNGGLSGVSYRRCRSERSGNFSSVKTGPTGVSGEARHEKRSIKPEPIDARMANRIASRMATDALSRDQPHRDK